MKQVKHFNILLHLLHPVGRFSLTKDETHDSLLFDTGQIDLTPLISRENDFGERLNGDPPFCVYLQCEIQWRQYAAR